MYSTLIRDAVRDMLATGATVSATSRTFGVSRSAIRDWRDRPDHVGPQECPRCDEAKTDVRSYASLLGFYLGDGCISAAARCHVLRVSCDAKLPGIVAEVDAAIGGVRRSAAIHHVRGPGVIIVQSAWKHWPCLFPQDGDGMKYRRRLELASWQKLAVEQHPDEFLQGLFHSDGCRVMNTVRAPATGKPYSYPRWMFSNRSEDIHNMCQWALDLVEVEWKRTGWNTCVSKCDSVARLDDLIGLKT